MYHSALVVHKSQKAAGFYTVSQPGCSDDLADIGCLRSKSRLPLNARVDAFTISGFIDVQTFEATLWIDLAGINLGVFYGRPDQLFQINLDLQLVKGTIKLQVNCVDEIWLHISTVKNGKFLSCGDCKESIHLDTLESVACAPWV